MDLSTTTIEPVDPVLARKRFREYQAAVRKRHSDEDAAIAAGYRAMAEGKRLISLSRTIEAGGLNDQGLPALAVARANAEWCYLGWEISRFGRPAPEVSWNVTFSEVQRPPSNARHVVRRFRDLFTGLDVGSGRSGFWWDLRAMVPPVPPSLRPARGLGRYHVLWEVDRWERAPLPPGDPALLRQIAGDLYAVVATWDLTELEQLVLARRNG